ncbi:hypothetical protein FRAHR75_960011 [Frankia sp. Hr75.2]|nr:hypothetical protein FRAHR75_960011 [Frankia sp. Hr75.2]
MQIETTRVPAATLARAEATRATDRGSTNLLRSSGSSDPGQRDGPDGPDGPDEPDAGAVGHAAIELARWSGANVVTTVSSPGKAALAAAAGAHHVVNYREPDAAEAIGKAAPDGVHIVVEVNPGANAELNQQVLATNGVVVIYADGGRTHLPIPILPSMMSNTRLQFILVYTIPDTAKLQAVKDITAAAAVGTLRVGTDAGLPLHRFRLEQTAAAHDAVEAGTVGKVLVDVTHAQEDPEQVHLPDEE